MDVGEDPLWTKKTRAVENLQTASWAVCDIDFYADFIVVVYF